MGEYADMMLDGTMCQSCGEYIGSGNGYPTSCASCARGQADNEPNFNAPRNTAKVACKKCGRHVKAVGLDQHMRDKHGGPKPLAQMLNEQEHEEQP